eukprot:3244884-Rhodomonas_salina.1
MSYALTHRSLGEVVLRECKCGYECTRSACTESVYGTSVREVRHQGSTDPRQGSPRSPILLPYPPTPCLLY